MVTYENPVKLFLENHTIDSLADIIAYTNFLRIESGASSDPPINLHSILDRFGMNPPKAVPLPQQQGMIIPNYDNPQIIIHAGDKVTRQKFSIAHELIELLFLVLPGVTRFDGKKENIFGVNRKEHICQVAAANLLMPEDTFQPRAKTMGFSFQSAELLAVEYEVSLMAALCRLADMYPKKGTVVLWRKINKPTELKKKITKNQIKLPGFEATYLSVPKLRVAWSYGNFRDIYLPKHKSIPDDSSVYAAWDSDRYISRKERIPFGKYNVTARIESKPIMINNEKYILTLIREDEKL